MSSSSYTESETVSVPSTQTDLLSDNERFFVEKNLKTFEDFVKAHLEYISTFGIGNNNNFFQKQIKLSIYFTLIKIFFKHFKK